MQRADRRFRARSERRLAVQASSTRRFRPIRRRFAVWGAAFAAPLLAVGLISGPASAQARQLTTGPHGSARTADGGPPAGAQVISSMQSGYGTVLATASGAALYTFSGDELGFHLPTACTPANSTPVSGTTVECTQIWLPLLASGPLYGVRGVQTRLLGTVARPDSSAPQVTYDGHPLYSFAPDAGVPGEVGGENIAAFLGIWHLVSISGQPDAGVATVSLELTANGPVLSTSTAKGTRTLYMLTADTAGPSRRQEGNSNCQDHSRCGKKGDNAMGARDRGGPGAQSSCLSTTGCSSIWPPLLTSGRVIAGPGVSQSLLGTTRRPSGQLQVTYDGHPLYLFAFDLGTGAPPGLTNGEDLIDNEAHGVWYTLAATGLPDPGQITLGAASVTISGSSDTVLTATSGFTGGLFTLYSFSADTATTSACEGSCARVWPPLLTSAPPLAGTGVTQGLVGSISRPDGTFQVTYDGHPLYLFSQDSPGALATSTAAAVPPSTNGVGVSAFGGTFSAVASSGTLIP